MMRKENKIMSQIILHNYQEKAAQELVDKYIKYQENKKDINVPIILTLASITGSGKTAMLAQAVNDIFFHYSNIKPIVF